MSGSNSGSNNGGVLPPESAPNSSPDTPKKPSWMPPLPPVTSQLFIDVFADKSIGKQVDNPKNDAGKSQLNKLSLALVEYKSAISQHNKAKQQLRELEAKQNTAPLELNEYNRQHEDLKQKTETFSIGAKKLSMTEFSDELKKTHDMYTKAQEQVRKAVQSSTTPNSTPPSNNQTGSPTPDNSETATPTGKKLNTEEIAHEMAKINKELYAANNVLGKYNDALDEFKKKKDIEIKKNREDIERYDQQLIDLKDMGEEALAPLKQEREELVKKATKVEEEIANFKYEMVDIKGKPTGKSIGKGEAEKLQTLVINLSAKLENFKEQLITAPDNSERIPKSNTAETNVKKDPAFDLIKYTEDIKKHAEKHNWKCDITADSVKMSDPTKPGHLTTVTKTGVITTATKEEELRKDAALFAALLIKSGRSTDIKDVEISGPQGALLKKLYIEERDKLLKQESKFEAKPPTGTPTNGTNNPPSNSNGSATGNIGTPRSPRPGGNREE